MEFLNPYLEAVKSNRKLQQRLLFCGIAFVGTVSFGGFIYALSGSDEPVIQPKKSQGKSITISNGAQSIRSEEIWVDRIEKDRDFLQKRVEQLEQVVKGFADQKIAQDAKALAQDSSLNRLGGQPVDDVSSVRHQMALSRGGGGAPHPSQVPMEVDIPAFQKAPPPKPEIRRISFQLDPSHSKKIGKSVDHYVPAGSFARGTLTSGVVASTSVGATANPQPVHIQLTDFGTLPRKFRSDIKACFIIGSSYGDLASERVFMRLEKLSCVERKTGEVIELTVDGYVTGEDGANGVRGILVDRSGPAMRNAMIGGFMSGVGNFFTNQQASPLSVVGGGLASLNPMTSQHMLQAGAGKGIGNAMEKLSDFYIKRAEQMQPVLEVEPGRILDVVFKSGFDLSQTVYRRSLMSVNDRERREVANSPPGQELQGAQGSQGLMTQQQGGFYGER